MHQNKNSHLHRLQLTFCNGGDDKPERKACIDKKQCNTKQVPKASFNRHMKQQVPESKDNSERRLAFNDE